MLDIERGNMDVPVEVLDEDEMKKLEESGTIHSLKGMGRALRPLIATIDRQEGQNRYSTRRTSKGIKSAASISAAEFFSVPPLARSVFIWLPVTLPPKRIGTTSPVFSRPSISKGMEKGGATF